jgi:hypothetical protein
MTGQWLMTGERSMRTVRSSVRKPWPGVAGEEAGVE